MPETTEDTQEAREKKIIRITVELDRDPDGFVAAGRIFTTDGPTSGIAFALDGDNLQAALAGLPEAIDHALLD